MKNKRKYLLGLAMLFLVSLGSNVFANTTLRDWFFNLPYRDGQYRVYTSTAPEYLWDDAGTLKYTGGVDFSSGPVTSVDLTTDYLTVNSTSSFAGDITATDIDVTYGITAATGVFSGAVAADEVNAQKVNIGANGYMSFVGTSYGLLTANSSKEQLELTLTAQNLGRQLVMGDRASYTLDFDHVPQENPTFYIHSSTSVDYDNTQWVSLAHDKSNAIFGIGKGSFSFIGGNVACQYGIIASSSTITKMNIPPAVSTQILYSTDTISAVLNSYIHVVSSGGIVEISDITAGSDGDTLIIRGTSNTDIIRFVEGGNIILDIGGSFDVGNKDFIKYRYQDSYWEEQYRKNNNG